MEPECKVRLEQFEGPLDLLLHLINRNRLDITDIPISLVTTQYLEYLEFLKALNIDVAAEYLVMAATLMHIKSKMLLPRVEKDDPELEDPRLEIVNALKELQAAKSLSIGLDERPVLERDVFQRGMGEDVQKLQGDDENLLNISCSIMDLIEAFRRVLSSKELPRTIEIERARLSLSERMEEIGRKINAAKRLSFFDLFDKRMERIIVIVTFLAILELSKRGIIRLFQEERGGDIILLKRAGGDRHR